MLGETSAPITVPSGRTRGVIANQGAVVVARKSGEKEGRKEGRINARTHTGAPPFGKRSPTTSYGTTVTRDGSTARRVGGGEGEGRLPMPRR